MALVPVLRGFRPQRVLSSPFVRCCETVQPIAEALELGVESVDELGEGHGADAVRLLQTMAGESAVLCTHGDVSTELLTFLYPEPALARADLRLQKGEVWVVQSTGSTMVITEHIRRPAAAASGSTTGT